MQINISRQSIYLLSLSIFLLIFVLLFSFLVLIPKGKEYREKRVKLNKQNIKLKQYEEFHTNTLQKLQKLQSNNRHTITALTKEFNPQRFIKLHKKHFTSLSLQSKANLKKEDNFLVYEVNATSYINSPKSFYEFLDALNKSDWIIGINFPINFQRNSKNISSTFTMKVYKTKEKVHKLD